MATLIEMPITSEIPQTSSQFKPDKELKVYYVSLAKDLMGCWLKFTAESRRAVEEYLQDKYLNFTTGTWEIPWCTIYEEIPFCPFEDRRVIIDSTCGTLFESTINSGVIE